jgi:hypothetical protein
LDYAIEADDDIYGRNLTVVGGDRTFDSNPGGGGVNRDATTSVAALALGKTMVVSVFNSIGSDIYCVEFQYLGLPVKKRSDQTYRRDNLTSQSSYGIRELSIENDAWTTHAAMSSAGAYFYDTYATSTPRVRCGFRNEYPFVLTQTVGSNISIVDSISAVNGKYTLVRNSERIVADAEGWIHDVDYELEKSDHI